MTIARASDQLRTKGEADDFDSQLGDAAHRYLGSGHRRVEIDLSATHRVDDTTFTATAGLIYPEDWSVKAVQIDGERIETSEVIAENVFGIYVTASLASK